MEHDTESRQRSAGHDLPGDPNPPDSMPNHGAAGRAGSRHGAGQEHGEPAGQEHGEPAGQAELAEPAEPADTTGDPRVDQVLRGLTRLDDAPVTEHPQVYENIHGALAEVLGELRPAAGPADKPRGGG